MEHVTFSARGPLDSAALRKARGAFFTPPSIAAFVADWAVRSPDDVVLELSAGDAEFLIHAVSGLKRLGSRIPISALAATLSVPYQRLRRLEIGTRADPELEARATAVLEQISPPLAA